MENSFEKLRKKARFYVLIVGLSMMVIGGIFKIAYKIQYDKMYNIMSTEEEFTWIDSNGNRLPTKIYPHQVRDRMRGNVVIRLDGDGDILIIFGFWASILGGISCLQFLLEERMNRVKIGDNYVSLPIYSNNTKAEPERPKVECPYCHSTNTKKIGTTSRMVSAGMFGLASKKIGKQWHCNNCGSDF